MREDRERSRMELKTHLSSRSMTIFCMASYTGTGTAVSLLNHFNDDCVTCSHSEKFVSRTFMKKYIHVAKALKVCVHLSSVPSTWATWEERNLLLPCGLCAKICVSLCTSIHVCVRTYICQFWNQTTRPNWKGGLVNRLGCKGTLHVPRIRLCFQRAHF